MHSSRERMRCENSSFSGSKKLAICSQSEYNQIVSPTSNSLQEREETNLVSIESGSKGHDVQLKQPAHPLEKGATLGPDLCVVHVSEGTVVQLEVHKVR